jgi:hypothetical protein
LEIARTMPSSARQVNRDIIDRSARRHKGALRRPPSPPEGVLRRGRVVLTGRWGLSILRMIRDVEDRADRRSGGRGRGKNMADIEKATERLQSALRRLEAAVEGRCAKDDAFAADLQAVKSDKAHLQSVVETATGRLDRAIIQVKQMLEA